MPEKSDIIHVPESVPTLRMKELTRKKKALYGLITVLLGISAGALLAEFGLRISGPKWLIEQMNGTNLEGALRYGSDAGWPVETMNRKFIRFKPNQQFPVDYYEYHTVVHTDQWGGRASEHWQENEGFLVPVVGDSFAFGLGVKDEETFISLFNIRKEYRFENLGVPGSALPNQLDIIEFRHRELGSPKIYVFTFYPGNDYTDILKYYGYGREDSRDSDSNDTLHKVIQAIYNNPFFGRSYLLQFLGRTLAPAQETSGKESRSRGTLSFRTSEGKRIASSVYLMMNGSEEYEALVEKYLQQALQRLMKLSKDLDFKPIFLIIPDKHQVDPILLETQAKHFGLSSKDLDPTRPDRFLEKKLESEGIAYMDTLSCLKGHNGYYFKIDDHLTAAGHHTVAVCIQDELNRKISSLLNRSGS